MIQGGRRTRTAAGNWQNWSANVWACTAEQRHTVQILVVHHLAMNRLAQCRDITDEKVLAELASMVETVPNLEQLYVLTFADTSAVGPGVWTMWKGTLLAELYRRTLEYLVRQRPLIALTDAELSQRLRPMILEALGTRGSAADVDAFLDVMPARYLMTTPPSHIAVHIGLLHAAHRRLSPCMPSSTFRLALAASPFARPHAVAYSP